MRIRDSFFIILLILLITFFFFVFQFFRASGLDTKEKKQKRCVTEVPKYVDRIVEKNIIKEVIIDKPVSNCPDPIRPTYEPCLTVEDYIARHPELQQSFPYNYFEHINFQENSWKSAIDLRLLHAWKNATNKLPFSYEYPQPQKYTKGNIYNNPLGFSIILFTNVCYNIKNYEMIIYSASENAGKSFLKRVDEKFKSGFKFTIRTSPFPYYNSEEGTYDLDDSDDLVISQNNWMIIPHSQRNIAHFIEAFNYLLHVAHHPSEYPPIQNLYLPRYNPIHVFPWINTYFDLIQSAYPEEYLFRIFNEKSLKESYDTMICFQNLGISSRIFHRSYGGVFASFLEVDSIRALAYKRFNLDPTKVSLFLPIVSILERANIGGNLPGRHISNMKEVKAFLKSERFSYRMQELILEKLKPNEQVQQMLLTDILIGSLGSGFVNCIFMLPGSVIIVVSPPYIGGFFFHTIAELSNIYYLPMYNYTDPIPSECEQFIDEFGAIVGPYSSQKEKCKSLLYKANIYIVPGVLNNYLQLAAQHIRAMKYVKPYYM